VNRTNSGNSRRTEAIGLGRVREGVYEGFEAALAAGGRKIA
jgi:hypothetical protein